MGPYGDVEEVAPSTFWVLGSVHMPESVTPNHYHAEP